MSPAAGREEGRRKLVKISIDFVAKVGDKVRVENYRSSLRPWEGATVCDVMAHIYADGHHRVSYRVLLHRRSINDTCMHLQVGQEQIERLT